MAACVVLLFFHVWFSLSGFSISQLLGICTIRKQHFVLLVSFAARLSYSITLTFVDYLVSTFDL